MSEKVLGWQDIFDLFLEGIDEMKGTFRGNDDVGYYFNGKYDDKDGEWKIRFWVI
jgi:hypothetical protein